ncbi:MAG: hypothetical protein L0Y79_00325 [Chlorobi bacterium]|nr:hypothetical protein [Chlorobiota bacterium]MCI0716926.1 hypothetical protein [Chlorobiota bacterium]
MELKKKDKPQFKASYKGNPTEEIRKEAEEKTKELNEFCESIIQSYKKASCKDEFEQSFFMLWYSRVDRTAFFHQIIECLNYYEIDLPNFFSIEKKLYMSTQAKLKKIEEQRKKVNNKDNGNKDNGEKILENVIDMGGSRIEIHRDKEQNLEDKLKYELQRKEFEEKINNIIDEAKQLIHNAVSYSDYLSKLKPIYYKLLDSSDTFNTFCLYEWYLRINLPYHEKSEWRDKIPKINRNITFRTEKKFSLEEIESFKKEREMLEKYKNEFYVIRPMILNDNYAIGKRENFILQLFELSKSYPDLIKFISDSVERQVQGFLNRDNEYQKSMEVLRNEQIIIYKKMISVIEKLNISDKEKQNAINQIDEMNKRLLSTNLKYNIYYPEYQDIKAEIDRNEFKPDERNRANDLGINSFKEWKYAFYVLAFRNENNLHFREIVKDESGNKIEFTKNSLDSCFSIFHNAYNTYTNRQAKK